MGAVCAGNAIRGCEELVERQRGVAARGRGVVWAGSSCAARPSGPRGGRSGGFWPWGKGLMQQGHLRRPLTRETGQGPARLSGPPATPPPWAKVVRWPASAPGENGPSTALSWQWLVSYYRRQLPQAGFPNPRVGVAGVGVRRRLASRSPPHGCGVRHRFRDGLRGPALLRGGGSHDRR